MKKSYDFRAASLYERREFYEKEFSVKKVKKWFKDNRMRLPQICAVDAGSETRIIIDKKLAGEMLYFKFSELKKKIKKYSPEDVYYDRNFYEDAEKKLKKLKLGEWAKQELVFDIDADNIKCDHGKGKQICKKCLKKAYNWTLKMKKVLEEKFRFVKTRIVYSGRGFHIHVLDKRAFLLSKEERQGLVKKLNKFPIDPWVSRGYIELIRLPYSLNGLVSRKVIPLSITNKFNEKRTIPKFLMK